MFWLWLLACSAPAPRSPAEAARLSFDQRLELPPPALKLEALVLADLEGDGMPDLIEVDHDWRNLGLVRLIPDLLAGGADPTDMPLDGMRIQGTDVAVEDFDLDGVGDLVIGWYDSVELLRGRRGLGFSAPVGLDLQRASQGPPQRLSVAWIDEDERPDLMVAGRRAAGASSDVWFDPIEGGEADRQTSIPETRFKSSSVLADLDGDGHPDLLTWDGTQLVGSRGRAGRFVDPTPLWSFGVPDTVTLVNAGDVDGDGDEEVALRLRILPGAGLIPGQVEFRAGDPPGALLVWPGDPARLVGPPIVLPDPTGGDSLAAGDVDGDGWTDLAVAGVLFGRPGLRLFLGGPDVYAPARTRFVPVAPGATAVVVHQLIPGFALVSWTLATGTQTGALLPLQDPDLDADGDGWPVSDDPDDTRRGVWPGAEEIVGDAIDQDGDGWDLCGLDEDNDGVGASLVPAVGGCTRAGLTTIVDPPDCDDHDPTVSPRAPDRPGVEKDFNCDGAVRCFGDADGDGFGDPLWLHLPGDLDCDDPGEIGASMAVDCDDSRAQVHPLAEEVPGDGVDGDCDGQEICYGDADRDGGRSERVVGSWNLRCSDPGYALVDTPVDCDDADPRIGPFAEERAHDQVDQDCDGRELCAVDADGDGFGSREELALSDDLDCLDAGEGAGVDCDDSRPSVGLPGAFGCPTRSGCAQVGELPASVGLLWLVVVGVRRRSASAAQRRSEVGA